MTKAKKPKSISELPLKTFAAEGVIADANGGIVLFRGDEHVHVWADSPAEYIRFEGAKIVERRPTE